MSNQIYAKLSESEQIDSTDSFYEPPSKRHRTLMLLLLLSALINLALLPIFVMHKLTDLYPQPKPLSVPLPLNSRQQDFWGAGEPPKLSHRVPLLTMSSPRPFQPVDKLEQLFQTWATGRGTMEKHYAK
jgi:hypothetical protein